MLRLGLKLTHDGGFAVLDDGVLVCSHEAEKSDNLHRHANLEAIDVATTLQRYGIDLHEIDRVIVDGWLEGDTATGAGGTSFHLPVAPYHEKPDLLNGLTPVEGDGLTLGDRMLAYVSYPHSTGHAIGTYATAPFASDGEPALILVWDGGMLPRLYELRPARQTLRLVRRLLGFVGNIYPVFGSFYGPFVPGPGAPTHTSLPDQQLLDLSGKVMAWAGLGVARPELWELFDRVYAERLSLSWEFLFDFSRAVYKRLPTGTDDADVIASFQAWVGRRLIDAFKKAFAREPELPRRLCLTGGCALNIVWNSALRASGLFEEVWVAPFPNDAGSALGAAAADRLVAGEGSALQWSVYAGPSLTQTESAPGWPEPCSMPGWRSEPCSVSEIARILHETGEPVVFLHGRAELGPRALGHRSILCSATAPATKQLLNEIKLREPYRPVAPICLEADAPEVFDPGTPDPYMLFTHDVRGSWRDRVPAIMHVDGTARLQTINDRQSPTVAALLSAYRQLSGIPLLCNTSANFKGSGFFPDARSAIEWGGASRVWCEGRLYSRIPQGATDRGDRVAA